MSDRPEDGLPLLQSLVRTPLRQPDRRSCGAAVLVLARMWRDPDLAARVLAHGDFAARVLATHREVTGPRDASGRAQLPWPRALGTPPWAVARHLPPGPGRPGASHRARLVLPWRRGRRWDDLVVALASGHPVPVYVGNRLLPRHVVLALPLPDGPAGSVEAYEPSAGQVVTVTREAFLAGRLRLGGWRTPWFVVLPR
jgi:hypothetical protein